MLSQKLVLTATAVLSVQEQELIVFYNWRCSHHNQGFWFERWGARSSTRREIMYITQLNLFVMLTLWPTHPDVPHIIGD